MMILKVLLIQSKTEMAETISYADLEDRVIGLGVATGVMTILAGILLQITRRVRNMRSYIRAVFSLRDSPKLSFLLTLLYYLCLITPLILLLVWVILLGVNVGANPAMPVLFTGLFVIVLFLPSYSSLFYFKCLALFLLYLLTEILIMSLSFQRSALTSFFSLTAILLTLNSVFVALALWLIDGNCWSMPEELPGNLKDSVMGECKIWKKEEEPPEIISGGLYVSILRLTFCQRSIIIVVSYLFSWIVLMTYSLVGYNQTTYEYQALVNSLAVVTTDFVIFMLIFITKQTGFNPILNAIVAVAVRACIVGFTGEYWFLGYCLLYLILMGYMSFLIVDKHYPKFEKYPTTKVVKTNILKMPETAFMFLLVMFGGLIYFMGNDNGQNLPISQAVINGNTYPFWALGVASVLLSFSFMFYLVTLRIVQRSISKVRSLNYYFMGCMFCGEYYFFLLLSYLFLVVLGLYLYYQTNSGIIWASCVFLPPFYQCFVIFYTNWKENDYLLLGDVDQFNKKIKKRKQREEKVSQMKQSVLKKFKPEDMNQSQADKYGELSKMNMMDDAVVEENVLMMDYKDKSEYEDWREDMGIVEAMRENLLLPTDKKIIFSIPAMFLLLIGYSIAFFFASGDNDMTAFTVSVQILVIFLCFIPVKRYFSTFQTPGIGQIIMFVLGFLLNYLFGIFSFVFEWNKTAGYTVLWAIINIFAISAYATFCLLRDKGLVLASIIVSVVSMVLSFGTGILLLALFSLTGQGLALIGVAFFYTYFTILYLIYLKLNKSIPWIIYPITGILIILTCFAVMFYAFVVDTFDDFYGFSVTYLVINLLLLGYASFLIYRDMMNRLEKPNFYSAYGSPIYKYDNSVQSVVENLRPMRLWYAGWFMFYFYTLLMEVFIADVNVGLATQQIFFVAFFLTFIYFVTYNVYRSGRVKKEITPNLMHDAWEQLLKEREETIGSFLDLHEIQNALEELYRKRDEGVDQVPSAMKVNPKVESDIIEENKKQDDLVKEGEDINMVIYEMEDKLEKAKQNDKILLVNLWTKIIFRVEMAKKKKMLQFTNFIRDQAEVLADLGIMIVLDNELLDLESVYNQAYQEYLTISPMQKVYFDKQMKVYIERKKKQAEQKEEVNKKENENQQQREDDLKRKFLDDDVDDSDLPIEKMRDSPAKFKKMKESLTSTFTDGTFSATNDILPANARPECRGWRRPSADSVIVSQGKTAMSVRQGSIGDCYLISSIGVLGKEKLIQVLGKKEDCPPGAYMVRFSKFGREIYVIVDDQFPVYDTGADNLWLFGRCENQKELFCNIIEKAYAKLYGGYQNIVGGKVAITLSELTGGFPEEIQLKKYQDSNTNEIFEKMLQFKKSGYLMGAGSPPNPEGDAVEIDGIYQSHAYLVVDVRNLDGNKIIKLRNPHGNESTESTLDWSDDSPKWTKRLKGLIGEELGADGAFWMGLDDFVYCFRALYVCRIFDPSVWKKVGPFPGEWKGETAAGLKSKSGRAILKNNPQYGIKVTRNCTIFIELTQEVEKGKRAENKIFFMVQRNGGMRIEAPMANKMAGMSGAATNAKTVSKEINLTASSYPYTFSLMTAIYEAGCEGAFHVAMYCDDQNVEIIDHANFDR